MSFKLGDETRKLRNSSNTPIFRKKLEEGIIAEANMDGSIFVDESVDPNSPMFRTAIQHEQVHLDQMADGRAAYGENWVMWEGKIYFRRNGMIDGPNGRWPEGDDNHPWEQEAIAAENE
tara:strand:+ start:204 stop:560 length:357 start_codon:yes stop_codon:yes gene_type:complete